MKLPKFDSHSKEIFSAASVALGLKISGAGFAFLFNWMIARQLGADSAGVFFIAFSLVIIASTLGRFGLDAVASRDVAFAVAAKDRAGVRAITSASMFIAMVVSTVCASFLLVAVPWLVHDVFRRPEMQFELQIAAFAVVPLSILFVFSGCLRGLKRVVEFALTNGHNGALLSLSAVVIFSVFPITWGAMGAIWAFVGATLIALSGAFWLLRRSIGNFFVFPDKVRYSVLIRSSCYMVMVALAEQISFNLPTLFLGTFGSAEDVGIYGVASRTALIAGVLLMSVSAVAGPVYASLYRSGNVEKMKSVARNVTFGITLLSLPLFLVFLISPGWVMNLFGADFSVGDELLRILAIGQLVNVATGSVMLLLLITGNEKILRNLALACCSIDIFLGFFLVSQFAAIGAAIAASTSLIFKNLVAAIALNRILRRAG